MLDTELWDELVLSGADIRADGINPGLVEQLNARRDAYHKILAKVAGYALADSDGGRDGQQREHVKVTLEDGTKATRTITAHAWTMMQAKGQIGMDVWAAGDRLASDFYLSQIAPIRAQDYERNSQPERMGAYYKPEKKPAGMSFADWYLDQKQTRAQVWQPIGSGGGTRNTRHDLAAAQIDAQDRLNAVRKKVGKEGYAILEAVCIHGYTYSQLETLSADGQRKFGTRKTIAKKLKAAIEQVGVFYGLWTLAGDGVRRTAVAHYG